MSIALHLELNAAQSQNLALINEAWQRYGDGDTRKLAYIISTTWHESKLMPISEKGSDDYLRKYEKRTDIGNRPGTTDYKLYKGRGFVQLTGRKLYINAGRKIGVNLQTNPQRALEPKVAARILVQGMMEGWFTGVQLSDFINKKRADYLNARKIVNGTDKAQIFADTAIQLYESIKTNPKPPISKPNTLWLWLVGVAGGLLLIGGIAYTAIYFSNKKTV